MCEYESTMKEMRTKLEAAEGELSKSRHLVFELRRELGEAARSSPTSMSTPPIQVKKWKKEARVQGQTCRAGLWLGFQLGVAFQEPKRFSLREVLNHCNSQTLQH